MNVNYEIRFRADDEFYKEYVNKILFRKIRRQTIIFSIVDAVLSAILLFLKSKFAGVFIFLCVANLVYTFLYMPQKTVKRIKENEAQRNNGEPVESVVQFMDDEISVSEGTLSFSTEYKNIVRISFGNKLCMMYYTKDNGISISITDFTVGDAAGFKKFIAQKCPDAKIENL